MSAWLGIALRQKNSRTQHKTIGASSLPCCLIWSWLINAGLNLSSQENKPHSRQLVAGRNRPVGIQGGNQNRLCCNSSWNKRLGGKSSGHSSALLPHNNLTWDVIYDRTMGSTEDGRDSNQHLVQCVTERNIYCLKITARTKDIDLKYVFFWGKFKLSLVCLHMYYWGTGNIFCTWYIDNNREMFSCSEVKLMLNYVTPTTQMQITTFTSETRLGSIGVMCHKK